MPQVSIGVMLARRCSDCFDLLQPLSDRSVVARRTESISK